MPTLFRRVLPSLAAGLAVSWSTSLGESPLPQVERLQSSPVLRHLKPNAHRSSKVHPAGATLKSIHLPEGFEASLVAAEPDLSQPVAFAFDEKGRIWVAEALSYPQRREPGRGLDRILIFEDREGDGEFETRRVFAEGLNLVSGLEVGFGGVWVGAAPELLFIPDRDCDDRPDGPPQILLEGFGFQDTHECLNSFLWGPDGWLYGNQGVFNYSRIGKPGAADSAKRELRAGVWRYHPVRHEFEVFAEGGSNQWGLDFDEHGQIFMTHCRSYWGRGGTSHVIQSGVFWNQANANYPAFIIGDPPERFPELRNFLLASARYDHGAGGAGEPGTDAIYGGHSHVGTMIYLGDNWPEAYRGRLFTHNLHGHQINQQINLREGSGFNTIHAGRDVFFCSDPKYVAVDLQYGPDGAVYVIDWHDRQHCHNPHTERWERDNGRLYRIAYVAKDRPAKVDLSAQSDAELVELFKHPNAWYGRTAARLLQERSARSPGATAASPRLMQLAQTGENPALRLKGLWGLHLGGALRDEALLEALRDEDDWVRAWAVQLACERWTASPPLESALRRMAREDASLTVQLYCAAALSRLPDALALDLAQSIVERGDGVTDRNLFKLAWQGVAGRLEKHFDRVWSMAGTKAAPLWVDWTLASAARLDRRGLEAAMRRLLETPDPELPRRLAALEWAIETRQVASEPSGWRGLASRLRGHSDVEIRRAGERLASFFGDTTSFDELRGVLASRSARREDRNHAFDVLKRAGDPSTMAVFLGLLDEESFRLRALQTLGRFDDPRIANELIPRLEGWPTAERTAALQTLTGRAGYAASLLKSVGEGKVKREQLNAYHIRQLSLLRSPEVDGLVARQWGRLRASPADRAAAIGKLLKTFEEAPLWAYDGKAGQGHFTRLCASCHVLKGEGTRLGPDLTGAGANGIGYYLENIIDPNAVVGSDFQMTEVETREGRVLSGVIQGETADSLILRTATEQQILRKSELARRRTSEVSLMPEGLLESLSPREQIELLKYLTSH